MVSCKACGRTKTVKTKRSGITFHRFPKGEISQEWIKFVDGKNCKLSGSGYAYICSKHFTEDCFDKSSKVKLMLKPESIPSIRIKRTKYLRCNSEERINTKPIITTNPVPEIKLETAVQPKIELIPNVEFIKVEIIEDEHTEPNPSFMITDLEEKIDVLYKMNAVKSKRIHNLQKHVWKLQKKITLLKSLVQVQKRDLLSSLEV